MSACGICGKARRGGARLLVIGAGPIRNVTACADCTRRAVKIAVAPMSSERERKRVVLDAAEKDVRGVLRALSRHLRGLAKGVRAIADDVETMATHAHADGLEQASDVANAWAQEPAVRKGK